MGQATKKERIRLKTANNLIRVVHTRPGALHGSKAVPLAEPCL
jgi:hypothetical protein